MSGRNLLFRAILASTCLLGALPALADERFAIVVGSNLGWAEDQPLRHAEDDARRMATVLTELGDYRAENVLFLANPNADELRRYLSELKLRKGAVLKHGQTPTGTFLFYYSGHADGTNLHLPGPPLSFAALFDALRELPYGVKIGILDACRSGSILGSKGGRPAQPFEVTVRDELEVRGTAVLTSSGADELSQESRAHAGSIFTHHLVSGLRGAADENGDGRVSLSELYRYAGTRTTLDTVDSPAGAQRPAFRLELKGQGELQLTQWKKTDGQLSFRLPTQRCFVTDPTEKTLWAEALGNAQPPVVLALPPGKYLLKCRGESIYLVAPVTLAAGMKLDVTRLSFSPQPLSVALLKGASARQQEVERQRLRGYELLRAGNLDEAMRAFEQAIDLDVGDNDAYRGKAQVLLALARQAAASKKETQEHDFVRSALKTDPALWVDPLFEPNRERAFTRYDFKKHSDEETPKPPQVAAPSPPPPTPPTRRFALGAALCDAQGLLSVSGELVFFNRLALALHVTPIAAGAGLSARFSPGTGKWTPFFGLGGHVSLWGVGLLAPAEIDPEYRIGQAVFATRSDFDRLAYVETGIQIFLHPFQMEFGLAALYTVPLALPAHFQLMPVLSLKYFWRG